MLITSYHWRQTTGKPFRRGTCRWVPYSTTQSGAMTICRYPLFLFLTTAIKSPWSMLLPHLSTSKFSISPSFGHMPSVGMLDVASCLSFLLSIIFLLWDRRQRDSKKMRSAIMTNLNANQIKCPCLFTWNSRWLPLVLSSHIPHRRRAK